MMKKYTIEELAFMVDHTQLAAYALPEAFDKLCREAVDYGFRMVAINSCQTAYCKNILKGTNVHVGAAISFPLGQTTIKAKMAETADAIENGADEKAVMAQVLKNCKKAESDCEIFF